MIDWIWQHIIGAALNGLLTSTWGLVLIVVVAGLLLGAAWRWFGWQGLVGAAAAVLGLFIYRKGWKDRNSLGAEHVDGPDAEPPFTRPKPKKPPQVDETDDWLKRVMNGRKH